MAPRLCQESAVQQFLQLFVTHTRGGDSEGLKQLLDPFLKIMRHSRRITVRQPWDGSSACCRQTHKDMQPCWVHSQQGSWQLGHLCCCICYSACSQGFRELQAGPTLSLSEVLWPLLAPVDCQACPPGCRWSLPSGACPPS